MIDTVPAPEIETRPFVGGILIQTRSSSLVDGDNEVEPLTAEQIADLAEMKKSIFDMIDASSTAEQDIDQTKISTTGSGDIDMIATLIQTESPTTSDIMLEEVNA